MTDSHFSQNPWNSADIIRGYKPDFTPRVAFILGSGLGALAEQIEAAWVPGEYRSRACR